MAFMTPPLPLDRRFLDSLTAEDERIEEKFRLAGPCVENACRHWSGHKCRLGEEISALAPEVGAREKAAERGPVLPLCGIRQQCRWFADNGAQACAVCPHIVTDNRRDTAPI
ncbi:hypothetical protein ACHBTE_34140 [Streptomyces sp. M41]|uniref:hypothetical protein n=1 Tax=Streptomyces sp. M41 TaxID=3059412 RepID=UPI00374DD8D7